MPTPPRNITSGDRPRITVFGGTGFVGRRIVRHLLHRGFSVRIAVRQAQRVPALFPDEGPMVDGIHVDVHEEQLVADALAGSVAAVNAVSLYRERAGLTFRSVHVDSARRIARLARQQGIPRLVHVSGMGADPNSDSSYIRARGLGDSAVREALPAATVVRPAVMFGPDDAFLNTLIGLLKVLPAYPLFGRGETRLQPVHVENVGEAIATMLHDPLASGRAYDIGGPDIFTYAALVRAIAAEIGARPILVPVPFGVWFGLARMLDLLPSAPVTRNQIELMRIDTIAPPDAPGLQSLGIAPLTLRDAVRSIRDAGR
jgi:NADH dehydrogenase